MKRKVLAFTMVVAVSAGMLTGCLNDTSSADTTTPAESADKEKPIDATIFGNDDAEYTFKVAVNTSTGDVLYESVAKFCEELAELSDGNVATELYGGSVLGSGQELLEGLSFGVADIYAESIGTLAPFSEKANIDAIPYLYSDYDHFINTWKSDLGEEMRETIGQEAGYKLLGGMYRGARITTATKEMRTVDDFKGFKLRAPSIDVYVKTWQQLGASPTPLAITETYTAIQQGTVEGQENPISECYNYGFYDVCKYFIKTNHVYSQDVFIMDRATFEALPADIQGSIQTAAQEASDYRNQLMQDREAEVEEKVIEKGVTIIDVDMAEFIAAFEGFVNNVYPDLVGWTDGIKALDQ